MGGTGFRNYLAHVYLTFWQTLRPRAGALALLGLLARPGEAQTPLPPAARDIADVAHDAFTRLARLPTHDSLGLRPGHRMLLLVPVVGYSQQTGAVVELALNAAFRRPQANVSTIVGTAQYTAREQLIFTVASSLWQPNNAWNLVNDWRIMRYPQSSYGLGMFTSTTSGVVSMDYKYLRLYQTAYRRVAAAWYLGLGYQYDNHWDIVSRNSRHEVASISRYTYGVSDRSTSSGLVISALHDNRANALNPQGGYLVNAQYRTNRQWLGSDTNYQTLLLEGRVYVHPSRYSPNILALWSYNTFTLSGNPPFLDLPATGWDMYGNTGRGFIQGRFRGKNFVYGEAEYRFGITRNRLLGGVIFTNAQSVTELSVMRGRVQDGTFEKVVPAVGGGLRLNLNKASRTNLSIDYGFGFDGSRGLSLNLGEVF